MKAWRFELVAAVVFVLAGAATAATPPQQPAGGLGGTEISLLFLRTRLRRNQTGYTIVGTQLAVNFTRMFD